MSSRDIDSTSENVLHDWAREEGADADGAPSRPRRRAGGADRGRRIRAQDEAGLGTRRARTTSRRAPTVSRRDGRPTSRGRSTSRASPRTRSGRRGRRGGRGRRDRDRRDARCTSSSRRSTPRAISTSRTATPCSRGSPKAGAGRSASSCRASTGSVTTPAPRRRARRARPRPACAQEAITIMVVPGAFELPLAATALAKTRRFACIVALGCVIRGDTPHFDYVSSEAASGLQLAALETGVPVVVRRPHARSGRAGRGAGRQGRRGRAQRARDGRSVRASPRGSRARD